MSTRTKTAKISKSLLSKISQLSDASSRKRFLALNRRLHNPEAVETLTAAVREQVRVEPRRALNMAEFAVLLAQQLRRPEMRALALRAKANALYASGKNKEAVALDERAATIFEKHGNLAELGKTLRSSLQPMILLGEYDRAFAAAGRARAIFEQMKDDHQLARLEINVGNIYHRQDRFDQALSCYEGAYEKLLNFRDTEGIAVALSNISMCLITMNDFRRALDTYKRAREYCEQHGMPMLTAQADYNIAYLYYLRGDYEQGIDMLLAAREACRKYDDAYRFALCHLDLSDIYIELNLIQEAQEIAHEGFIRFRELEMGYEEAKCLANEAIAVSKLGKPFRAIELFDLARASFVREKNLVWPWLVDLYKALILFQEDRPHEARRLCVRALDFFKTASLKTKEIHSRLLLARLELRSGNPEAALKECAICVEQQNQLDIPDLRHQTYLLLGEIQIAAGKWQEAYQSCCWAREAVEELRSGLRRDELKIAFVRNKQKIYEDLVELCLSGKVPGASPQKAFEHIEEAKSRSLRDLLLRGPEKTLAVESSQSGLVRKIRDLREELNWYYHRIEDEQLRQQEAAPANVALLQDQAIHKEKELLQILREMPASQSPAQLAQANVSFREIQGQLSPDEVLLEYFSLGDRILAAVLTRDRLDISLVSLLPRVRNILQMLQFQLSKHQLHTDYIRTFESSLLEATQAHLRDLYQELIAPLRPVLSPRHLIVIPHGILHYVPFHALFDGAQYLIDAFKISYAPSASIYTMPLGQPVSDSGPFVIFGVPDERAPFIRDEAESLVDYFRPSELFLGPGATLANLKDRGREARLLHLATHGEFRPDNPLFSSVRLADSHLTLYDLYQLHLPAELITLSGCATGLNLVSEGDELLGLVRGLFAAGAQSLLLSLWDVHDKSTSEFMQLFYSQLAQDGDKLGAFQRAVVGMRARHAHPYFWAPFLLVERRSHT
ncbi:MAG TPA: CHAT domain-containing tetratricopeptide repeat protein [Candidatus Acidoferrales bacterium]|nr:CHAT domain-containing tetratricopeptide repeat protein [Candidatus Acidoferrales bacterium]